MIENENLRLYVKYSELETSEYSLMVGRRNVKNIID